MPPTFMNTLITLFTEDSPREEGVPSIFITESSGAVKSTERPPKKHKTSEQAEKVELSQGPEAEKPRPGEEKYKWDEYLLSIVSKPTAQWIVTQRTDPADKRYKVE